MVRKSGYRMARCESSHCESHRDGVHDFLCAKCAPPTIDLRCHQPRVLSCGAAPSASATNMQDRAIHSQAFRRPLTERPTKNKNKGTGTKLLIIKTTRAVMREMYAPSGLMAKIGQCASMCPRKSTRPQDPSLPEASCQAMSTPTSRAQRHQSMPGRMTSIRSSTTVPCPVDQL